MISGPYDARGRRDPFDNLELQLQQKDKEKGRTSGFTVASTKLTGIVRGESLLALVETPDGVGYILKPGDTLGYVGTTGNARGTPPHLHYGIYRATGGAIDPYPLLRF